MVSRDSDDGRLAHTGLRRTVRLLVLGSILSVALLGATGSVAATDTQRKHGPCPGENPNVGLENAANAGEFNSGPGILRAAFVLGCPMTESDS